MCFTPLQRSRPWTKFDEVFPPFAAIHEFYKNLQFYSARMCRGRYHFFFHVILASRMPSLVGKFGRRLIVVAYLGISLNAWAPGFAAEDLGATGNATSFLPLVGDPEALIEEGKSVVGHVVDSLLRRSHQEITTPFDDLIDSVDRNEFATRAAPSGGRSRRGLRDAQHMFRLIYANQNPRPRLCGQTRLLLTQFPDDSYEGLGSVLSLLVISLAEALYSNRTLVWGADLTPLLELSRAAWESRGSDGSPAAGGLSTTVHGTQLDCSRSGLGGSSFACLFEPLSTCSLADVSAAELRSLARDARDPAARVTVISHRRAVTAYTAPPGSSPNAAPHADHIWAGALASYAFRPQIHVASAFESTRGRLDGGRWGRETACMHVRHGDVLNVSRVRAVCALSCLQ